MCTSCERILTWLDCPSCVASSPTLMIGHRTEAPFVCTVSTTKCLLNVLLLKVEKFSVNTMFSTRGQPCPGVEQRRRGKFVSDVPTT